jgi:predicted transcriptional regulator
MGLISSDVDKLIVTLKKNKYISLDDLVKKSGIAREMVEEWLPVLEDSGYIKIVYQFTKIYIEWIEDSGARVKVPGMDVGISEDEIGQNIISEDELPKPSEQPEVTPEPIPAVHKKKEAMKLVDEKEVGKIKLKTIKRKPLKTVMMSTQDIQQSVKEMFDKKKSDTLSPYAEQLKQYWGEIDAAKKELEQMKRERAKLYSTTYEPMEKEFRAGYNTIAERIANKQKKILELQEEALKLPEMLEQVDRQQMKMHEIGERVKTVANESTNIINDSLEELQNLTDDSSKQIAMAKHAINQGARSITETQTLLQKIESVESDLSQRMADVEEKLRDEQDKLEKLADIWQDSIT